MDDSRQTEVYEPRQVDDLLDRFDDAWSRHQSPAIEDFLLPDGDARNRDLLIELIKIDLEYRWRDSCNAAAASLSSNEEQCATAERRPQLQDYIARFRTLGRVEELPLDLILEEYRVRCRWGNPPKHAEFARSFRLNPTELSAALQKVDQELRELRRVTEPSPRQSRAADSPSVPKSVGSVFGDYELLGKLGAGGMGIVYRARQCSANRIVALKLIRPEQLNALTEDRRQAWLDRFRAEARTAARLEHDHVVTVYDVGELEGTLFYSMRLVEGQSLADIVREGPLENHRAARLIQRVADAVDHAHCHGVLHRDLKPQNILIRQVDQSSSSATGGGDTSVRSSTTFAPVGERPVVADFGLAKCLEQGADGATHTGEVMGSPSYMSPEQALDASRCTAASDIYSLGATLYDALTARPPFRASSAVETLRQVMYEQPVAPRDLNPAIDLDLQTITLKALAKEPSRRYLSAAEMADDLRRYIDGQPIKARPIGPLERSYRWCRRNPVVASLGGVAALLLLVVAVGSVSYSWMLSRYADREHEARMETEGYLRMTLDAIDEMLTEVGEESLAHVPLMDSVRESLLTKALQLHRRLLESQPSHPELQLEFARAQHRMGDIYELLGDHDQAQAAYQEAIRHCLRLEARSPADVHVRHYLAISHTMLGECYRKTAPSNARRHYEAALELQQELHRLMPENRDYHLELTRTLNNLALLLTETGQHAHAESMLNDAISHLKELAQSDESADILADLARSQINLGVLLRQQPERTAEVEAAYQDAITNLRDLVASHPENREYQYKFAVAMLDLGNLFTELPDGAEDSLRWTREANSKLSEICDHFPGTPRYKYELANSYNSVAVSLALLNKPDDAKTQFNHARQILDQLAEQFPGYATTVCKYSSLKGRVVGGLGFLQSLAGDLSTARPMVEQAIECQQEAARLGPENPEFIGFLSEHHKFLATILDRLDLPQQAEKARKTAESLDRQATEMKDEGARGQESGAGDGR